MRTRVQGQGAFWATVGYLLALGLCGCPGDTELAEGDGAQGGGSSGSGGGDAGSGSGNGSSGTGGTAGAGGSGAPGNGGSGSAGSGSGTGGSGSSAGSGGGDDSCPKNLAVPAICQVCDDGGCGEPFCENGKFAGFRCSNDVGNAGAGSAGSGGGGGGGCVHGGCSSQLCTEASDEPIASTCEFREEYACYQAAECARQADGQCGFTESDALSECLANAGVGGGSGGPLQWFATCGDPVCSNLQADDDPSVPNCSDAMAEGTACTDEGARCETLECGVQHVCASESPIGNFGCPISRARYKREIEYVDDAQLSRLHDELTHLPLATWQYKHEPGVPQLGFIIDDIEPSAAVSGDHVNVYGYLSMAVAAIQVQQRQIDALHAEVEALRGGSGDQPDPATLVCAP